MKRGVKNKRKAKEKDISDLIILFDGVCNLCCRLVGFIIKRDTEGRFRFAARQSAFAKEYLKRSGFTDANEFLIYLREGKAFVKSEAILLMLNDLGGLWKLFYCLVIIPRFVRDYLYDIVAANRYRFFGRRESCMIPSPDVKQRFLE